MIRLRGGLLRFPRGFPIAACLIVSARREAISPKTWDLLLDQGLTKENYWRAKVSGKPMTSYL